MITIHRVRYRFLAHHSFKTVQLTMKHKKKRIESVTSSLKCEDAPGVCALREFEWKGVKQRKFFYSRSFAYYCNLNVYGQKQRTLCYTALQKETYMLVQNCENSQRRKWLSGHDEYYILHGYTHRSFLMRVNESELF